VSRKADWLIDDSPFKAIVGEENGFVTISNGLVARTFSISPDGCTTGFLNMMTGNELLRGVKPEAELTINGDTLRVGGLTGQPVKNYLAREWISGLKADSLSPFKLSGYQTGEITARFEWKKRPEWMAKDMPWPPHGKRVDFTYLPENISDTALKYTVIVHYEIYDGLPLICKWITVSNASEKEIVIDGYVKDHPVVIERKLTSGICRRMCFRPLKGASLTAPVRARCNTSN